MTDSVEKKIEKLKSSISKHEYNYFVLSQPTISDYEFDQLVKDFEKLKNDPDFSVIGHMTNPNEGINLINGAGSAIPLEAQG